MLFRNLKSKNLTRRFSEQAFWSDRLRKVQNTRGMTYKRFDGPSEGIVGMTLIIFTFLIITSHFLHFWISLPFRLFLIKLICSVSRMLSPKMINVNEALSCRQSLSSFSLMYSNRPCHDNCWFSNLAQWKKTKMQTWKKSSTFFLNFASEIKLIP